MTQRIDRAGTFRGRVIDYAVKTAKSGAVSIAVHIEIDGAELGGVWEDWTEYEYNVFGDLWVVGKTGYVIEWTARDLVAYAAWDGDLESVANGTWEPPAITFAVESSEYEGVVRYRLARLLDPENPRAGTVAGVTADECRELQAAHGSAIRAVVADLVPEPEAKPRRRRKKAAPAEPVPAQNDEVPF